MGSSDAPEPRSKLKREAARLLEEDDNISAVTLVSKLPLSILQDDDNYPSWHTSKPLEPIVRALLLTELRDSNFKATAELLEKDGIAEQFGFTDGDSPSRSTLSRAWSNRISDDLQFYVERNASWIRNYAREIGHPLGTELTPDERRGRSERTKQRVVDEKLEEVPTEVAELIEQDINFLPERADNAQYSHRAFIEAECTLGIERQAAETGCKNYDDYTTRESGGPDADTLLHYVKQLSKRDILWMFHNATGLLVNQAKHHLEFDRPVTAAIDITYVGYWGDKRGGFIRPAPPDYDYEWCHKFAALSMVGQNTKFFLALRPFHENKSLGHLVERLISDASEHVTIDTVYADREFEGGDGLQRLEKYGVEYIIPVRKNARIKRAIADMSEYVEIEKNYGFYSSGEQVETTRLLLPSPKDPSETTVFYTNKRVSDDAEAIRLGNRYRHRWGIENAYKSLKTFLPWTTSNNHNIRLFHFAFSALLYNVWRLVDFLVKKSIPREFSHDTVVLAMRFMGRMRVVYTR